MSYTYTDILNAESPREITWASFWRVRSDYDSEAPWGLFVRRADLVGDPPPVHINDVTEHLRRYLPADGGELRKVTRKLHLHWYAPKAKGLRTGGSDQDARGRPVAGSFHEVAPSEPSASETVDERAEADFFPPEDQWHVARAYFLPDIPRTAFVELLRTLGAPAGMHTSHGELSSVHIVDARGSAGAPLTEDRPGYFKAHNALDLYVGHLLDLRHPDELASYLAGTAESMASKYCEVGTSREEMHQRVRSAATSGSLGW